ncbi:MAG: hypothetical protein AAGD07_07015 [Planctomycetota bacterium]
MLRRRGEGRLSRPGHSSLEILFATLMVLVVGAICAPNVFRNSLTKRETRTQQTLNVIRDAIALYREENNAYPPGETFVTEIAPYLNQPLPIPECLVPTRTNAVLLAMDAMVDGARSEDTEHGWAYDPSNGSFRLNSKRQPYSEW